MSMMPIPQNYKNNVDWIKNSYTDAGVDFPDGFQKDAIQNAMGARKTNSWKGWKCDISYISNSKGNFVIIEDEGTLGLIGRNIPGKEVNEMMARGEVLNADERLARFTSLFNSGDNTTGGGLYGAGKSVYAVASEDYTYYFDSLRADQKYVANVNAKGQVLETAYEDDNARDFIHKETGLPAKTTVGTRVIIKRPVKELVNAIQNGEIQLYIQASWWLIINRLSDGAAISVNGVPVTVPDEIKKTAKSFELSKPHAVSEDHKIKHFGLYVFENGTSFLSNKNNQKLWSGISYYRKGMKIGGIDIKDVPQKVDGKFWGYVEVEKPWEEELAKIEDRVHFGVSKGKKRMIAYQDMKNYCNGKFQECMRDWGYIKDKESTNKKLNDEIKSIAEELQSLFDRLRFEDLGKGPQRPDFDVRWQDIHYPVSGTEKVTSDDEIAFSFRIKSSYTNERSFNYKLIVKDPQTGGEISQIQTDKIKIKPNAVRKISCVHKVTKSNSKQHAENRIVLTVKVIGGGKEKTKVLPYFYDIDKPDNSKDTVRLTLHQCDFPVQGSRRVNFGQAIRNICWNIENKRNYDLNYKLNASIHNASDPSCPKIDDVGSWQGVIPPFEDALVPSPCINEVLFEREKYERYLSEGLLELRARLIANADDPVYEKGDKITFYHYKIYLNTDEKNGKIDSFIPELVNAPERYERSWRTAGNGRSISINIGHAAYTNLSEVPDIQHDYLREQMMKQYVLLYLDEGRLDTFGEGFADLEPQEAADKVLQKIESVYYESLK